MVDFILQYWLEFIFGIVGTYFIKYVSTKLREQDALKLGLQALLRDRIIQSYTHYEEKGYVPIYARENMEEMSKQYFNLGGNGVIHSLMEKFSEMPTSKQEEV